MILYGIFDPFTCLWHGVRRRLVWAGRRSMKQVELPRLGVVEVAASLDFLGDSCLRTNLLTKKELARATPGMVLEILSDNLSSVETIPFMLAAYDCVHLVTVQGPQGWKIYVQKRRP
jgi:TusA-related sulfurtransferase